MRLLHVPDTFFDLGLTITSVLKLWNEGNQYLITSRLNQDPLENTFGIFRRISGTNDHPDEMQFSQNFQHLSTFLITSSQKIISKLNEKNQIF